MNLRNVKIKNLLAVAFLLCCLFAKAQTGTIEITHIEYDCIVGDQKGMKIHSYIQVVGWKGKPVNYTVFIYKGNDGSGGKLFSTGDYTAVDGHVCTFSDSKSDYDDCVWKDWSVFIPYRVFPHIAGSTKYSLYATIRRNGEYNWERFATTPYKNFTLTFDGQSDQDNKPSGALAKITFLNCPSTTASKTVTLNAGISSNSSITNTAVYVNGVLERGISAVKNDGFNAAINRAITLAEGVNVIKLDVTNAAGTVSAQTSITYQPKGNDRPNDNIIPATQQKRLALVIGNGEYKHATRLPNPNNDATDVAASLRRLGFTVIEKHDLSLREFKQAVSEFGDRASTYDASMLYYAGHAIEKDGKNYLIPVDAVLEKQIDIEYECVRADYVLDNLEAAKSKMNIIILDACRNNPISRGWSRSASGGLASMVAPAGTFMVYSTSPGSTAADGEGKNSPFTTAFLKCLNTPNVPIFQFFSNVAKEVKSLTGNVQRPWVSSDLDDDFYFNRNF